MKKAESVLFFLTLLFLPTQLGKHFWPQFSFIYSLPVDYLSPTLYFWDLLVLGLLVIFLIQKKHINKPALIFFYFFILTQVLSLVFNREAIGVGLIRLEQYAIAGLFGVYIASFKKIEISKVYLPLGLAVLGESVLAILQFFKGGTIGFWILGERAFSISTPAIARFDFYGREFLRPYATFPHPNVLAGFLLVAGILLNKKIITFLTGLIILLTVSRLAITAWVIASLWLIKGKGRILLICLIFLALPILYTRFEAIFSYDNISLLRREFLTEQAINIFLKNPLFGVGLNNFIPVAAEDLLAGPSRFLQPVHNIFLLSLSETGLVGLIGLISLIGYPIYKKKFLIVWSGLIFLGLFDHYFLTLPQGYRLLFLVWGLSFSVLK